MISDLRVTLLKRVAFRAPGYLLCPLPRRCFFQWLLSFFLFRRLPYLCIGRLERFQSAPTGRTHVAPRSET